MAKTNYQSVDQYIAAKPEASRPVLEQVRAAIRKALPEAEEVISYQIPAYRVPGGVAIYFAGWKEHYSIYPAIGRLLDTFKKELTPYEIRKATIRFELSRKVPVRLIGQLAKFRAKEMTERAKAKKKAAR